MVPKEYDAAENLWWKKTQLDSYSKELGHLQAGKMLSKTSRLYQLSPSLNSDGILRIQGRLNLVTAAEEGVKNPVILDPKHAATKLLLQYYHEKPDIAAKNMW